MVGAPFVLEILRAVRRVPCHPSIPVSKLEFDVMVSIRYLFAGRMPFPVLVFLVFANKVILHVVLVRVGLCWSLRRLICSLDWKVKVIPCLQRRVLIVFTTVVRPLCLAVVAHPP